jgi:ATP-binding cassette subfamily B protein
MKQINLVAYLKEIFIQYKLYFCLLLLLSLTSATTAVVAEYKIKQMIDDVQLVSNAEVTKLVIAYFLYAFANHFSFFLVRISHLKFQPTILASTIIDMYNRTTKHSLYWFDSHFSGEISSKISDFQENFIDMINLTPYVISTLLFTIVGVLFLTKISIPSVLVIVIYAILYSLVMFILLSKQLQLQRTRANAKQRTLGVINDSISNIFSVKIIGSIFSEFKLKLIPALNDWKEQERRSKFFDAIWVDNADTIMATIMLVAQIYVTAHLYRSNQISAGSFAFIMMITLNIRESIDRLLTQIVFQINPQIATMNSSYEFINRPYDVKDSDDAMEIGKVKGAITFKKMDYAYSGSSKYIFNGLNLSIRAGERIGIVGHSGAGKTTLIKCLVRYFDISRGEIKIDSFNIKNITQESLWANIAIIPQDITMFHRSILENLRIAKLDATIDEIKLACKKARIHDDIEEMAMGYDTLVGERGVKISGGQRQRVAIARAILKNAPILILDEATSALDTPTEHLIQDSLNEMFDSNMATTIVVAHRLSTLLHMDRIIVFEQGNIVEEGTHNELLEMKGVYKNLWDKQVGGYIS